MTPVRLVSGVALCIFYVFLLSSGVSIATIMLYFLCGPLLVFLLLAVLLWRDKKFEAVSEAHTRHHAEDMPSVALHSMDDDSRQSGYHEKVTLLPRSSSSKTIDRERLKSLPFTRQILTLEFLLFVVFINISILRMVFFMSSAKMQLDFLGQRDDEFIAILGTILPLGFLAQFVVGVYFCQSPFCQSPAKHVGW